MLHSIEGDLLLSRADLLAHGVAPADDFKNGLARAMRERFPALYKDFRHYCHLQSPQPGGVWLWQGVDHEGHRVRIASLFTQEAPANPGDHPGRARTEHVNHALHELKQLIETKKISSLALPRLATGVGGLEWEHVEPLIRTQLGGLKIPVCIYTKFTPGLAAREPLGTQANT